MRFLTGFKNLKIRKKLFIGFGLLIILMVVIVIVSVQSFSRLERDIDEIIKVDVPALVKLQQMKADILEGIEESFAYLLLNEPEEKEDFFEKMEDFEKLASEFEVIAQIGAPSEEEESALFQKIVEQQSVLIAGARKMFEDFEKEGIINTQFVEKFEESTNKLKSVIDEFIAIELAEADEAGADAKKNIQATRGIIIFVGLIVFVFALFFTYIISRLVSEPIRELSQISKAISGGDLTKRAKVTSKDEIGQLAHAFNDMTAQLQASYESLEEKVRTRTKELEEEKIKASHEKDKIATILYSIGDGVFVVDAEYRIVLFNKMAATLSGFSLEEVMGKRYDSILKFVLEKNEKVNDTFIKDAIDTGEVKEMANHTVLIKKDESKIPVADSAAPIKNKDGIIVGCVVVFRDITKEREIDRAKSEFVSLASHQLRTPLSSINWYTEMLLAGDAGEVTKEQKKYLEKVSHGSQRMAQLVSALLNVSRLELGTLALEPEPTNLKHISEGVLEELKPEIVRKKLRVMQKYDSTLPDIPLDPKVIQIVFQNVLSNAVKYTPEGGTVQIFIEKKGREALIAVRDTGYGIPENQQDKIFTKLFRADNVRARDTDGTGLGLYIAQAIVKEAGGKIWFSSPGGSASGGESVEKKHVRRSPKGEGWSTTFYITLPLAGMKRREGTKGLTTSLSS